jgi:hypothetical protein
MGEIINKVAESGLIQLDLADFKPNVDIVDIDLAAQLWQGLVIREKDFRDWIKQNDWSQFRHKAVYVHCTADAIIPTWAYMLVGSALEGSASDIHIGERDELYRNLIHKAIYAQKPDQFIDGKVIIKGCSDIGSPEYAMVEMVKFLQPLVQSIMYGEPCSTVPVYKRKLRR